MRILSNLGETPRNPPGSVLSAAGAVAIKSNRPPYRRPTATEILKLMERKGLWLPRGGTVLGSLNCPKIQRNLQKKFRRISQEVFYQFK